MIDKKYILGGISGILESFFSHPFDFYKVKNQEAILKNKKIDPLLKYLYNNIKIKGFTSVYVGIMPKLLNIFPSRLTFWGVQGTSIKYLSKYENNEKKIYLYSGSPFEVIKTKQIFKINDNKKFNKNLIKNSLNGIEWPILRNSFFCSTICLSNNLTKNRNDLERFLCNSTTGFISSIITQPLDFMKTKYQSSSYPIRYSIIREIKEHKGLIIRGAFPRGYVASINMGVGSFFFNKFDKYF
jgi:hypothetical protein